MEPSGGSSSLQGQGPAQFPPLLQPQVTQSHGMGSCSRGCVHTTAGLGGSKVLSWGCAGAGMGQEWPGHIHRVIYPSGPAQSRAISTLSSLSKPRHCPAPGLSTGAACKETWKPERMMRVGAEGWKPWMYKSYPEPSQVCPSPAGQGLELSPGIRNQESGIRNQESPSSGASHGSGGRGGGGRG